MRYQIAIITLLGILSGCSDSDAPDKDTGQPSTAEATDSKATPDSEPAPAQQEVQVQPQQPANIVRYECNDGTMFEAELLDQGVAMVINDISYDLRQQPASSGTLYADDSTSFHVNGDKALLTNEQGTLECIEVQPTRVGEGTVPEPVELKAEREGNQGD